jgi:hypothetical protein
MTKEERRYLRAAYHHYDKRQIRHTATPDYRELVILWKDHRILMTILYNVLTLQGDEDGQSLENLGDIWAETGIED